MGNAHQLVEPGQEDPLSFAVAERDRSVVDMVRQALNSGRTLLAFQPVVDSRAPKGTVAFYEGLIRILDENGRPIPAVDFMPIVENLDIAREIDCASLRNGLGALGRKADLRLAVNMSARSIGYPKWRSILSKALKANPALAERLILEITESSAMQMPDLVMTFMDELQDRGVTFALDDFGAGNTAFRYFKDFYFDIIKIDGQFSRNVQNDPNNQCLINALIGIGRHFDMFTVAERVETKEEADFLVKAGIDCMQGYYYGAPETRPAWLRSAKRAKAARAS